MKLLSGLSRRRLAAGMFFLFWCVLFTATHVPRGPRFADGIVSDKLVHFGCFAVLAFLACWALFSRWRATMLRYGLLLLALAAYAAMDELLQIPIPRRTCDFRDWLADVAGVAAGVTAYVLTRWLCGGRNPGKTACPDLCARR
jgi:VanZ family protein